MTYEDEQEDGNQAFPIGKYEDVEFSEALADTDDLEAIERAEAADERQENE